jgi:hypothetical protein
MARLTSFWRNLFRRRRVERDLDDELRATMAMLVQENNETGMAPDEVRRAARLELGSVEAVKDDVRDVRAGAVVDNFARDVRYAARTLVKTLASP